MRALRVEENSRAAKDWLTHYISRTVGDDTDPETSRWFTGSPCGGHVE